MNEVDMLFVELSDILYRLDPAHTCCKENECYEEYDGTADTIISFVKDGYSPTEAVEETFVSMFDIRIDPEMIFLITNMIDLNRAKK